MTRYNKYDANRYMAATRCNANRPAIPDIYQRREGINWRGVAWLMLACAVVGVLS
jgi:hypothetical protein